MFEYCYRDAANYKTHGAVWLVNDLSDAEVLLRECFEDGFLFVAEQLAILPLHAMHFAASGSHAGALDHGWHEFGGLRATQAPMPAGDTCAGSLAAFVGRAQRVRGGAGWVCPLL